MKVQFSLDLVRLNISNKKQNIRLKIVKQNQIQYISTPKIGTTAINTRKKKEKSAEEGNQ